MRHLKKLGVFFIIPAFLMTMMACTKSFEKKPEEPTTPVTVLKDIKPYRTFLHIQRYTIENNGEPSNPISNVRLELKFPNETIIHLPGGGQYWPIGNGQIQEIDQTFEIPWAYVMQKDGFNFDIQMVRKGTTILPCKFEVIQLSEFNRSYVCRLDLEWQIEQKIPEEKLDKEAIQIRIFTDRNSPKKDVPSNAIALIDKQAN